MNPKSNPYSPATGVDAGSFDAADGSSRGRNAAYWFIVACWYFPLAVSLAFFIGSRFDVQAMGFWAIVRNGPFINEFSDSIEFPLFILPILLEVFAIAIIYSSYRSRRLRWIGGFVLASFLWGCWGCMNVLDTIHIS